jgi:hypothetical protein
MKTKMEIDFSQLKVTPGDALADQARRFLDSAFPFDRKRVAEQEVVKFIAEGRRMLLTLDYKNLPDLVDRLWSRHRDLTDPRPKAGEPKPVTPRSEVERCIKDFQRWRYESRLIDACESWLQPGETISVRPLEVATDKNRQISRSELKVACRQVAETGIDRFQAQFIGDEAVAELVRAEEERERAASRPPWHDSRNYDLPDPRR